MVVKKINENNCKILKVAILAEEPIGWGSGKHYFQAILDGYTWNVGDICYRFSTKYIFDKDILQGKLNNSEYDVFLVPGGGVGDVEAIIKGFTCLRNVKKWKKQICNFIKNGGGYVGICGGAVLLTRLKTGLSRGPNTFYERQYDKSSLGLSCVTSYYKDLALPLFNQFQKKHPEKIGAMGYVFSFAPGITIDGEKFFAAGIPIEFQIKKDNPIFTDFLKDTERIRWWGGPALLVPEKPDREVKILARYPKEEISEGETTKIYAWRYIGGIVGLIKAVFKAFKFILKEKESLKYLPLFSYYFSGDWRLSKKLIELDFSDKPCMTAEIFPNENKGRILLCTAHPEYMIWYGGHIEEVDDEDFHCIGKGFYRWKDVNTLSEKAEKEFTHTWWIVRRIIAWAGKVTDEHLPPILNGDITKKGKLILLKEIFWDGQFLNQLKDI
jgi:hypothetical protein